MTSDRFQKKVKDETSLLQIIALGPGFAGIPAGPYSV
jgi:hypothetical protein